MSHRTPVGTSPHVLSNFTLSNSSSTLQLGSSREQLAHSKREFRTVERSKYLDREAIALQSLKEKGDRAQLLEPGQSCVVGESWPSESCGHTGEIQLLPRPAPVGSRGNQKDQCPLLSLIHLPTSAGNKTAWSTCDIASRD